MHLKNKCLFKQLANMIMPMRLSGGSHTGVDEDSSLVCYVVMLNDT
jgi:hypothetical protein